MWYNKVIYKYVLCIYLDYACCDPKLKASWRCFNIDLNNDMFYGSFFRTCMDFTRSSVHCKNQTSHKEQVRYLYPLKALQSKQINININDGLFIIDICFILNKDQLSNSLSWRIGNIRINRWKGNGFETKWSRWPVGERRRSSGLFTAQSWNRWVGIKLYALST